MSICLLTFNGEKYLKESLEAIFAQEANFKFEVLAVDSGSCDQTLNILKNFPVKIVQIPNQEFGHGKTRNLAVNLTNTQYVVFLVQDAVPASKLWLRELLNPFHLNSKIVATYGKHLPRVGTNPFIKRDIEKHFKSISFDNSLTLQQVDSHISYSPYEWGKLVFFSDVNSALRRSYVLKHRFKDVNYAEDQLIGEEIIKNGYIKAYCPKAPVYHSHTYPIYQYLFRYYDEYKGLKNTLGYEDPINIIDLWPKSLKGWLVEVKYILGQPNFSFYYKLKWIFLGLPFVFFRRLGAYLAKKEGLPNSLQNWLSMDYRLRNLARKI